MVKCDCGRELSIEDWHYGRCIKCKETIEYSRWLSILEGLDGET